MKKINSILLMMLISCSLFAKKVDVELAKSIAINYYSTQVREIKGQAINNPVVTETIKLGRGKADLIYVFNFENGFVMISADDGFTPILGFSFEGKFSNDNQPPALTELIESYKDHIVNSNKGGSVSIQGVNSEWNHYLTNSNNSKVASGTCMIWPKYLTKDVMLSTTWSQECYYNDKCPVDARSSYCGKVPAGCVAVAMAQVMKYWNYPTTGASSHSYIDTDDNSGQCPGSYGNQYSNFGGTTYNWSNMPNSISSNNDPISTLVYHCGVSVDMDYGYGCSTVKASVLEQKVNTSFTSYFKYSSSIQFIKRISGADGGWEGQIINELNNNRPVVYSGTTPAQGHVFVLDGYTKMQDECCTYAAVFHANFGLGGANNGYYSLSNILGYNYQQAAFIGIKPTTYNYPVPAQPSYISEPACSPHCINSDVDYFVPSVINAASYEWQITGIYGVSISANGRYATINSHRYGTGTLWCRAINGVGVAGPWQTRSITISNCLGRLNKDEKTITENQVYPNPATNSIHINLFNYENYTKAELMDLQGKVLKTVIIDNENTVIHTGDLNNGIYLIKLTSNQGTELKKISILK